MSGKFYSDDFAANDPLPSSADGSFRSVSIANIFQVILVVMLGFTVARVLARGGSTGSNFYVDFSSLLTSFSKAPTIPMDWISYISTNYGSTFPFGFQWLGEAIDFVVQLFSGIMFASVAVSNALVFVFYFIRWALL